MQELFQNAPKMVQAESIGSVRFCVSRIIMDFEEDPIYSGGHSGAGEHRDEFGWPPETPLPPKALD